MVIGIFVIEIWLGFGAWCLEFPLRSNGIMPIQVKTMRDIWDKGRKKEGEVKGCKIFPPEIGKYYLEYLARKKAFLKTKDEIVKAFAEYEKKLGKAGFSKI